MEKIGYIFLIIVAICWFIAMLVGLITSFPVGIIGLVAIIGFGLLFIKTFKERLAAKKEDRYSKDVEK